MSGGEPANDSGPRVPPRTPAVAGRAHYDSPFAHAPELGRAQRILGRFHVTGIFWFRIHVWGVRHLPSWAVGPTIAVFTAFFFMTLRNIGRAIAANLDVVLGPTGGAAGWARRRLRVWRTMWSHAWCNTERYERLTTRRRFDVAIDEVSRQHWAAATAGDGPGVVLVTAHVGAWDVSSFLPALVDKRRVHVVREQEMHSAAQEFIETLYGETGGSFELHFAANNPALGAALLAALRRGEMVGLQGDRAASTGRVLQTALCGRPFPLPAGPAALARASGARVLPLFCFREGRRRFRLVIRPPIDPAEVDPAVGPAEGIALLTQRIAREMEWAIRERPHQWFCFRRVWE